MIISLTRCMHMPGLCPQLLPGRTLTLLQAGILSADKVLTVSPNYAMEIGSGPDKGVELDRFIREVSFQPFSIKTVPENQRHSFSFRSFVKVCHHAKSVA